jgi:hypothetical protein
MLDDIQLTTSLPLSSPMDGSANGGMTGSDVSVIYSLDFHQAHVTGIGGLPSLLVTSP